VRLAGGGFRRTKPGANGIGTGCDSRGMEVIIGRTLCFFFG